MPSLEGLILDDLRVRGHELFLSVRGLGGFYCNSYVHTFPTRFLDRARAFSLLQKLQTDEMWQKFPSRIKAKAFPVVQLDMPLVEYKEISEQHKQFIEDNFFTGHYTQLARWRIGIPGSLIELEDFLVDALRHKLELQMIYTHSRLDSSLKLEISRLDAQARSSGIGYVTIDKPQRLIELHVISQDYFKVLRPLTKEELVSQKIAFIDIEMPGFRRPNPEITAIGLGFLGRNGFTGEIHTTRKIGLDKINGYAVYDKYGDYKVLVEGAGVSISSADPYPIFSFNTQVDLIEPREAGEFIIGAENTEPKKEVAIKFRERVRIYSRMVIDMMRWAKSRFDYLPDQRLETVSQHVLGAERFHKLLSHIELDEVDQIGVTGKFDHASYTSIKKLADYGGVSVQDLVMGKVPNANLMANQFCAYYLSRDVNVLVDLFNSSQFQESLDDYVWLSQNYGIPISVLSYSPAAINDAQYRTYFNEVGTFKEAIYPKTIQQQQIQKKGKATMKKIRSGLLAYSDAVLWHKNLVKCFVPWGDFFLPAVGKRFPEVSRFVEYKSQFTGSGRQYMLSLFSEALAEWMAIDYARFYGKKSELLESLHEQQLSPSLFAEWYKQFKTQLNAKNMRDLSISKLAARALCENLPAGAADIGDHRVPSSNLAQLMNLYSTAQKLHRRFCGMYVARPEEITNLLQQKSMDIMQALARNRLTVKYHTPDYLFLSGAPPSDVPLVPVDTIEVAYLSNHIYYRKGRAISYEKERDTPRPQRTFHEMRVTGKLLDCLLREDISGGLRAVEEGLSAMRLVAKDDLVFFAKSSGMYKAFENGREIYFKTEPHDEQQMDEQTGRRYVLETHRGQPKKVFIMQPESFSPDFDIYFRRLEKITDDILRPLKEIT
jgi:hypothetical protein